MTQKLKKMELKKSDCLTAGDFKKYQLVKAYCDKINKNIKAGNLIFTSENRPIEGYFGFDYIGHAGGLYIHTFQGCIDTLVKAYSSFGLSCEEAVRVFRILCVTLGELSNERKTRMNLVRQKQKNEAYFLLNKANRYAIRKQKEFVNITPSGKRPEGKGIS